MTWRDQRHQKVRNKGKQKAEKVPRPLKDVPIGEMAGGMLAVCNCSTGHRFGGELQTIELDKGQLRMIFKWRMRSCDGSDWEAAEESRVFRTHLKWKRQLKMPDDLYCIEAEDKDDTVLVVLASPGCGMEIDQVASMPQRLAS